MRPSEHANFGTSFDASPLWLGVVELRGASREPWLVLGNKRVREELHFNPEVGSARSFRDLGLAEEVVQMWADRYEKTLVANRPLRWDYTTPFPDQSLQHISVITSFERYTASGDPQFSYVCNDVTEKKLLIASLSQERARLHMALDVGGLATWDWDPRRGKVRGSSGIRKLFLGESEDSDVRLHFRDFLAIIPIEYREAIRFAYQVSRRSELNFNVEFEVKTPNGHRKWIQISGQWQNSRELSSHRLLMGIAKDITLSRMASQAQADEASRMAHLAKMTSLGEMASGIAHEINNPLAIIQGYSDVILKRSSRQTLTTDSAVEIARSIKQVCQRIGKIILGLKSIAREAGHDPLRAEDLSEIVLESLTFSESKLKKRGIELELDLHPQSISVFCRSVQISQVILNLLNNAADAVGNMSSRWVKVKTYENNQFGILEVYDGGPGVPQNICHQIFEPFFTTKGPQGGTGLGLSICRGILSSQNATLEWVGNAPGAVFRVKIPKAQSIQATAFKELT